jgi:hypothetical protein
MTVLRHRIESTAGSLCITGRVGVAEPVRQDFYRHAGKKRMRRKKADLVAANGSDGRVRPARQQVAVRNQGRLGAADASAVSQGAGEDLAELRGKAENFLHTAAFRPAGEATADGAAAGDGAAGNDTGELAIE